MEHKHFSHVHGLVLHQVPQESEVTCSGCNFPGIGSVYVCWQCRFFLHDYCFNASRSMNHPSHPSHPLNLFPYPTYPSNSFYCNHCSLVGTGFSYGCSHCEFDLHVHCTHLLKPPSCVPNEIPGVYPKPTPAVYQNLIPTTNTHVLNQISSSVPQHAHKLQTSLDPNKPMKTQGTNHFSHSHPLHLTKVKETDYIICSACEKDISGLSYSCKRLKKCDFHLHESCFELKQQIHHPSHPDHPLTLLSSHPYKERGVFSCNACLEYGSSGFDYHCSICKFDLHVTCALLPENVERKGHKHALILTYTSPITEQMREENPDITLSCDVCKCDVDDCCWIYRCEQCDYHSHLSCVNDEEVDEESDKESHEEADEQVDEETDEEADDQEVDEETDEEADNEEADDEEVDVSNTIARLQLSQAAQMQRLQFQMQMAKQRAQTIISCGQSLANL